MKLPIGSIGWLELHSPDSRSVEPFYKKLFNWSSSLEGTDFTVSNAGEAILTIVDSDQQGWVPYFVVASLDQTMLQAYSSGGELVNQGIASDAKWAILRDPQGSLFALWECL